MDVQEAALCLLAAGGEFIPLSAGSPSSPQLPEKDGSLSKKKKGS